MIGADTETAELLRRARHGEVEAFAAVFESLRPLVHRVACRVVGASDADDVVMDTYLKAWQSVARFEGRASWRTWLCRIAHNSALDVLRRRRRAERHQVSAGDPGTAPVIDHVPDPSACTPQQAAVAGDLRQAIQLALAQLTEEQRQVVLLREVDGLSYAEIAAALGIHLGTVMSRLFYARRRLQRLLKEHVP
jgi:RNA polymerase sigma-70 factor (ECF subfamily)